MFGSRFVRLSLGTVMLSLLLAFTLATTASANDVAKVDGLLKRAESNLQLVDGSIGRRTSPPKGSAAKLSKMRLDEAAKDITAAGKILETLNGSDPDVAKAAARHTAAVELHTKLVNILTGGQGGTAPPAADPNAVKLNYQQEDLLKNARFHVSEVEGNGAALTTLVAELKPQEDQLAINHRVVEQGRATIANAQRKAGFATDALGQLPENGAGVAAVQQRLVAAQQQVTAAAAYLEPLARQLRTLIDPAQYPAFQTDLKRLRELSRMYANPEMTFQSNRAAAADAMAQSEAAYAECIRIAQAYLRLMQQQTDLGKQIEGAGNGFLQNHAAFLAMAEQQKTALPTEIRQHFAEAAQYAKEAVEAKKPAWFTGGIPQRMEWAEEKMALLAVLDPEGHKTIKAEYDTLQKRLREQAASLRTLIIEQNKLPNDGYQGADRDKVIAVAKDAWSHQQKDFKVLAVRIPSESWARDTKWTYSNGTWYFVDRSKLQVRLIVADHQDPTLAIDRPINIWMDHQKGGSMIGTPLRSFKDELPPSSYLLRSRVKK